MPVASDFTSIPLITIAPENSIMDAARLMHELDVGALPVCDGHTVVGLVTDRDITLRAAAHGRAPRSMAVAEVMRWRTDDETVDALLANAIGEVEASAAMDRSPPAPRTVR